MHTTQAPAAMIAPLLHDVETTCRVLGGIGRSKLFELIKAGEIRAVKIGKRTFVAQAEIERFVAELTA